MTITEQFSHDSIQGFRFGKLPIGRPALFSHVYFVDGLLIDTGHSRVRKEVLAATGELAVEQTFLTHYHEDHSGNLPAIKEQFNGPIYASELCCEMMKAPPSISFAQWVVWGSRPAFHGLVPIEGKLQTLNYQFELIPIPGHAPDMMALYEPNQGWLFSADLYVHHYISYFLDSERMWPQIESIRRILQLDFDVLLCGHNPQLKNGKAQLQKKLDFLEDFYGQVAQLHRQAYPAAQIMRRLQIKERWGTRLFSHGRLSALNMVRAVIRDEVAVS